MKQFAFICTTFFCTAISYSNPYALEERLSRLEYMIQNLSDRMDQLSRDRGYMELPSQPYNITSFDDINHTIGLSNGWKFSYSYALQHAIAHWLIGQPVRLEQSSKRGFVKLVNLETLDWIEVSQYPHY